VDIVMLLRPLRAAVHDHSVRSSKDEDQNAGGISERVALRNALPTLADLQRIAYARKPSGRLGATVAKL